MSQPTSPAPSNPNTPNPSTPQNNNTPMLVADASDGLGSRFYIAVTLIVGMLIIIIISVAQAQFTQTTQLAAIFSGWITSIAAFYFYGESNAQNQTQIKNTTDSSQFGTESDPSGTQNQQHQEHGCCPCGYIQKNAAPATANTSDEVLKNINALLQQD